MTKKKPNTIQDRPPNFRDENGKLYLVRCFACENERGTENYMPAVATGQCAWCGWKEDVENDQEKTKEA